jgi:hypothetical protein
MNWAARLLRYAKAWAQFDCIRSLTFDSHLLEEIIDQVFDYADSFPIQIRDEIAGALKW